MRVHTSALQVVTTDYDKAGQSLSGYQSKNNALEKVISTQKEKLKILGAQIDSNATKYGENSQQVNRSKELYNKTEIEIVKTTNAIKVNSEALEKSKGVLGGFANELDKISGKLKKIGEGMVSAGKTMSAAITAPIVAAGAFIVSIGSNYEEAEGKVRASMGSMTESIIEWSDTTLKKFGVASVTALQMAGDFGNMATGFKIADKEAADMSMRLTELASDLATFHNTKLDVAQTALTSIFTGEAVSLKKYGVIMTQAEATSKELSKVREDVEELKDRPRNRWEAIAMGIVLAVVGVIVGIVFSKIGLTP